MLLLTFIRDLVTLERSALPRWTVNYLVVRGVKNFGTNRWVKTQSCRVLRCLTSHQPCVPFHAWLCLWFGLFCKSRSCLAVCLVHFLLPCLVSTHRHMLTSFLRQCQREPLCRQSHGNKNIISFPLHLWGMWLLFPEKAVSELQPPPSIKGPSGACLLFPFSFRLPYGN